MEKVNDQGTAFYTLQNKWTAIHQIGDKYYYKNHYNNRHYDTHISKRGYALSVGSKTISWSKLRSDEIASHILLLLIDWRVHDMV